jgi:peroxiredoxin-like protein
MKPFPHDYNVHLTGGPAGYAVLSTPGIPDLPTAPPSDFDGPGDAWSPEHLLLAAVQTCFLFTLRAIARASRVDFVSLELDASGTVNRQEGVTRFTEIVLRPRLVVSAGTDRERALRVLEKSERNCLVSASLSTSIRLEPQITEGESESWKPVVTA